MSAGDNNPPLADDLALKAMKEAARQLGLTFQVGESDAHGAVQRIPAPAGRRRVEAASQPGSAHPMPRVNRSLPKEGGFLKQWEVWRSQKGSLRPDEDASRA
ncbi:hypothetical protein [Verrucomicrobium sp. 3C]|uniref:hypothetical protein n=1 Tax=Verrucomicrobium sp. 3C TaxID=1134055 RepID=UPI00037BF644|nr:hypothetical protein [Verrucomicrobium sp. 3C]